MSNKPNAAITALMTGNGFVLAGGMWGDAFWKKLKPNVAVAITERKGRENIQIAPITMQVPVFLTVYRGEFYDGWKPEDGEGPCDDNIELACTNVHAALSICATLVD